MKFIRNDSVYASILYVIGSVVLVSFFFYHFHSIIPGVVITAIIIGLLEYNRYVSSQAIYKIAYVDELTGIPNLEQMKQVLEDKIKNQEAIYLAVFDIKNFKIINDLWGYEKGDQHLRYIGEKLREFSDEFEFACRCENDNFAVVIKSRSEASCEDLLMTLFSSIDHLSDNPNYHVQYACGMVRQDGNYADANSMMDCAKIAQKIGKKSNTSKIVLYDEDAKDEMIQKQQLKDNLHTGIKNNEFLVYLQPKYNLKDDTLAGAEALIRWNYQHKEMLSPAKFIPVFEEDGSVGLLDQYVLETVSDKIQEWVELGYEIFPISVNVSRVQLTNQNLVKEIKDTVQEHALPFDYIDLELTESAAYDNMEHLLDTMNAIKHAGFKLSMDDFGTGYSSLGLLQKMPLDTLKLDKAFVDGYVDESCEKERLMICDIINMAHHLGIQVLAEGVETKLQRDMLKNAGCEIVQGYYYSKPIPMEEYEKLLQRTTVE